MTSLTRRQGERNGRKQLGGELFGRNYAAAEGFEFTAGFEHFFVFADEISSLGQASQIEKFVVIMVFAKTLFL